MRFRLKVAITVKLYTFSRQSSEKSSVSKLLSKASLKKKEKEVVWKFNKEPMRKALLRRTNLRDDLKKAAIRSFTDILLMVKGVVMTSFELLSNTSPYSVSCV